MKLFLAKDAADRIDQLKANMPHACLLEGTAGTGLRTIALDIAGEYLAGIIEPTDIKGNVDHTASGLIRVTQIRELASSAINKAKTKRVYIIDDADKMNHQAQNAFLKMLEEPAPYVHFILLSHQNGLLLPTITSRVQTLHIPMLDTTQSHELLDALKVHDATTRTQLLFLAEGLPAELTRLATDKELFASKVTIITAARQLLQGTLIDKFKVIHAYMGDRPGTLDLLTYAERILMHSIVTKPSLELIKRADEVGEVFDRIAHNGNIRIQLLHLVV